MLIMKKNKNKFTPFEIKAAADNTTAEVLIFGDIGDSWYGDSVAAKDFAEELAALKVDEITIRINSYGGAVADGLAIYNAIKRHSAHTIVAIEGVALSIASLIAMAADEVTMASNAIFMVHAPWGGLYGNAKELRDYADVLDKFATAMASSYTSKTGQSHEDIMRLLNDGTDHYYTADEAIEFGFVDEVTAVLDVAAHGLKKSKFSASLKAMKNSSSENHQTLLKTKLLIESKRKAGISVLFAGVKNYEGVNDLMNQCLSDKTITEEQAGIKLLDKLGEGSEPLATDNFIMEINDQTGGPENRFKMYAEAISSRFTGVKASPQAQAYQNRNLSSMARDMLETRGVRTSTMSDANVITAALTHSSDDFPILLQQTGQRILRASYDQVPSVMLRLYEKITADDFRMQSSVNFSEFPALDKVNEGAEFKSGSMTESKETYSLSTYGRIFGITRQALINDDLSAFAQMSKKMGRTASEFQSSFLLDKLTANPLMSDGKTLFHADHGNISTASKITVSSISDMRKKMRLQKGLDGETPVGAVPSFLLVPAALETEGEALLASTYPTKNEEVNPFSGSLELLVEPRLDSFSDTGYYLFSDPVLMAVLQFAYLQGFEGPQLAVKNGWNVSGTEFKVSFDIGAGAIEYRGAVSNAGL